MRPRRCPQGGLGRHVGTVRPPEGLRDSEPGFCEGPRARHPGRCVCGGQRASTRRADSSGTGPPPAAAPQRTSVGKASEPVHVRVLGEASAERAARDRARGSGAFGLAPSKLSAPVRALPLFLLSLRFRVGGFPRKRLSISSLLNEPANGRFCRVPVPVSIRARVGRRPRAQRVPWVLNAAAFTVHEGLEPRKGWRLFYIHFYTKILTLG